MSYREIEREDFEKLLFGKEKVKIEIPKYTEILITTTISRSIDGGTNISTITYPREKLVANKIKEEMDNKEELVKLIQENPKLPFVFMVSNDEIADGYGYTVMENFKAHISEIYEYEHYGDRTFADNKGDVQDYYYDYFSNKKEYENLSDEEYEKAINDWIDENIVHYKAIVLYVS